METASHSEIRFDCPNCRRPMAGDIGLVNEMITCPDCGHAFIPSVKAPQSGGGGRPAPAKIAKPDLPAADSIRRRGDFFATLAGIVLGIGILSGLRSLYVIISGEDSGFALAGACVASAAFLYLIAQVIHIRANTQK